MILNSCITRLFISIDAFSSETYDKVRIPVAKRLYKQDRLKMLEENIIRFIKLRSDYNRDLPLVRASFLALNANKSEIEKFVEKWKKIVDTVEIQKHVVPSFEFNGKDKNGKNDKIEKWYKDIGVPMIHSSKHTLKNEIKKMYSCREPWSQMSIYADGTILPCCATFGRNIPIGNIKNETVKEAWNGLKINKIRNDFKNNQPNKICKTCLDHTTTVTNDIF